MNRYDHLIRQAYNGVGIQMLFTLFYTKFVRAAGIGAPDFPVFDNEMIGAAIWSFNGHFLIFRQVKNLYYLTAAGDFCSGSFFARVKTLE